MIASMITLTTPIEIAAQRSSDRTMPSSAMGTRSAHHAAGQEHEKVDQQPPREEQAGGERGAFALEILIGRTGCHGFLLELGERRRVYRSANWTRNWTL